MKKYIIPIILIVVTGFYFFKPNNPHIQRHNFAAILNSGGSPSAKTGAPGEGNCTMCHSGSVNDGNGISSTDSDGDLNLSAFLRFSLLPICLIQIERFITLHAFLRHMSTSVLKIIKMNEVFIYLKT